MFCSKESRIAVLAIALICSLTVVSHSIEVTKVLTITSTTTDVVVVTAPPLPPNKAETV